MTFYVEPGGAVFTENQLNFNPRNSRPSILQIQAEYRKQMLAAGRATGNTRTELGALYGHRGLNPVSSPPLPTGNLTTLSKIGFTAGSTLHGSKIGRAWSYYSKSAVHRAGMDFVRSDLGMKPTSVGGNTLGKTSKFGRVLGPAFLAVSGYMGYNEIDPETGKKRGISGALHRGGEHLAYSYAIGAGMKALGMTAGWGVAAAAVGVAAGGMYAFYHGAAGGSYAGLFRPWVAKHSKRHAELEMGSPVRDDFGNAATIRQRSVNAINKSRLNGRTALGQEAAISHRPY